MMSHSAPTPFHQPQIQQAQHHPAPAAKPQEHRPLKVEEHKVG